MMNVADLEKIDHSLEIYYNAQGKECDQKDAVEVSILNFDKDDRFLFSVRSMVSKR